MALDPTTEKVSVNINTSTLSTIDLLVDSGYYSNRSDFINQAVRSALQQQQSTIDRLIETHQTAAKRATNQWFIGLSGLTARDITAMDAANEIGSITGYGVFTLSDDVDRDALYRVITGIQVRGKVIAPADVKAHYGLK